MIGYSDVLLRQVVVFMPHRRNVGRVLVLQHCVCSLELRIPSAMAEQ